MLINSFFVSGTRCPSSAPLAYLNGDWCCSSSKEENRPDFTNADFPNGLGDACDGGDISIRSACCPAGEACPEPPCQNEESYFQAESKLVVTRSRNEF